MKNNLQSLIDSFLEYLDLVRGYSEQTVITYSVVLRQMLDKCEFYEEEGKQILDIMSFRLEIPSNNKRTITKKLSAIRSFANYLNDHRDMAVKLKGDASIKVPQTLPKPIEEDYIDEVLSKADLADRLLVSMLYGLGLRISELSGLELGQISKTWIEIVGKGNKSRQLPIMPYLQSLIKEYREVYAPKNHLFEKRGIALNSAQLRYKIDKLFRAQGIKATPHQLRHSFATHLLNNGARISDVSELLGHSSMATTQVYTKLASAKKLDEYMKAHPLVGKLEIRN